MRVLLVDDHRVVRESMRRACEAAGEEVVGEAADGAAAAELAERTRPDVVLMDLSMPGVDGVEGTRRVRRRAPEVPVLVLSVHEDGRRIRAALDAGAVGYLSKGAAFTEVLGTARRVAAGGSALSPELALELLRLARQAEQRRSLLSERQVEILQRIADGASTKQVARALGITQKTVHNHLNATYRRLDAQSLTHAVLSAVRLGIVELGDEPREG